MFNGPLLQRILLYLAFLSCKEDSEIHSSVCRVHPFIVREATKVESLVLSSL